MSLRNQFSLLLLLHILLQFTTLYSVDFMRRSGRPIHIQLYYIVISLIDNVLTQY